MPATAERGRGAGGWRRSLALWPLRQGAVRLLVDEGYRRLADAAGLVGERDRGMREVLRLGRAARRPARRIVCGKCRAFLRFGDRAANPYTSADEREIARNKARIESGETFRGQKPSDWRRGASPFSTRRARCTPPAWCGVSHRQNSPARVGQGENGHLPCLVVRPRTRAPSSGGPGPSAHPRAGRTTTDPASAGGAVGDDVGRAHHRGRRVCGCAATSTCVSRWPGPAGEGPEGAPAGGTARG